VVNQVQNAYNGFQQRVTQYQEHGGAVVAANSLQVQYSYANGSANTIRPTGVTYPNGRQLNYVYNAGNNDALSRISSIGDSSFSPLVAYTYLGLGSFVRADYQQPGVRWDLIQSACGASSSSQLVSSSSSSSSSTSPVAENYAGLDQFGRVVDNLWCKYSAPAGGVDQIQYGYDLAGNRIWRRNVVAATGFDELYAYDGAERLADFSRGTLNGAANNISSLTLKQEWDLDATGNWSRFQNFDQTGATPALDQQRSSDNFNEIINIAATVGPTWVTPQYDRNGNMTLMPQPSTPTSSFSAIYDAWNRLIALTSGSSFVGQYAYDGQNWRTRKTVSGQLRDFYYTAGWQDIEERVSTANWASSSMSRSASGSSAVPQLDRQFVWGLRYIDDLVLRDRNPGGSGSSGSGSLSERLYALQDANWNVDAIVDTNGTVQERYSYSAYGVVSFLTPAFAPRSSSLFGWDTLYAGYKWDGESGLCGVRWRRIHPYLGNWISEDPLSLGIGEMNLYAYTAQAPLTSVDPSGLDFIAIADRTVHILGWFGIWGTVYHYSLEYWRCRCRINFAQVFNSGYDPDVLRRTICRRGGIVQSFELLADDRWRVRLRYPAPGGLITGIINTTVSVIVYSDSATRVMPIYDSGNNQDVQARWNQMLAIAAAYRFAEQVPGQAATLVTQFNGPFVNWPRSFYVATGTNSNVFIRFVVTSAGIAMQEISFWHPPEGVSVPTTNPPPRSGAFVGVPF
jgi:RHS repeat-associated protein